MTTEWLDQDFEKKDNPVIDKINMTTEQLDICRYKDRDFLLTKVTMRIGYFAWVSTFSYFVNSSENVDISQLQISLVFNVMILEATFW